MKKNNLMFVLFLVLVVASPMFADGLSSASTGGGLPWEGAMSKIVKSITGPVAFGISVIAIVGAGAGLIFGGEISGFLKSVMILALVIGMIVAATSVLNGLFTSGAVIIASASSLVGVVVA